MYMCMYVARYPDFCIVTSDMQVTSRTTCLHLYYIFLSSILFLKQTPSCIHVYETKKNAAIANQEFMI